MIVIFNWIGVGIVAASLVSLAVSESLFAPSVFLIDVVIRIFWNNSRVNFYNRIVSPRRGGQFFFLPCWLLAIAIPVYLEEGLSAIGVVAVFVLFSLPAFIRWLRTSFTKGTLEYARAKEFFGKAAVGTGFLSIVTLLYLPWSLFVEKMSFNQLDFSFPFAIFVFTGVIFWMAAKFEVFEEG